MILEALWTYKLGTYCAFILLGWGLGIITGVKAAPPSEDIEMQFGKVKFKVRGKQHQITDGLDVTHVADVISEAKPEEKKGFFQRWRERRLEKKANKNK